MKWLETEETVRFNEIDEWGMAWYGNYMAWFEAGRLAILREFDLMPSQMNDIGFIAPVINLQCDYKHPAVCGDRIVIRTTAIKPEIAALIFKFEILRKDDSALLAKGETTQVLQDLNRKMIYRISGELEKRLDKLIAFCSED